MRVIHLLFLDSHFTHSVLLLLTRFPGRLRIYQPLFGVFVVVVLYFVFFNAVWSVFVVVDLYFVPFF